MATEVQVTEKKPRLYHVINNCNFAPAHKEDTVLPALAYEARPDDNFVVTYPKCGTTWTQQICVLLFNNGTLPDFLKDQSLHAISPFLEASGPDVVKAMPRPGLIKTHLPFRLTPYHPQAKYIYVIRNPKDACVSFYYHTKLFKEYNFQNGSLSEYLRLWLLGEVEGGSYADHVLSWWSHKDDENVLILFYEEMKEDVKAAIKKIGTFLGSPLAEKVASDPEFVERVAANSDFSHMKNTMNQNIEKRMKERKVLNEGVEFNFIRKGIVGDWRNHFNEEETKIFDQWFAEKFANTGLEHVWDKYKIFNC